MCLIYIKYAVILKLMGSNSCTYNGSVFLGMHLHVNLATNNILFREEINIT